MHAGYRYANPTWTVSLDEAAIVNNLLGTMEFPIPRKPAGQVSIDCRFTYDSSGMLDVDVTIPD